jgi:hypothetical protein
MCVAVCATNIPKSRRPVNTFLQEFLNISQALKRRRIRLTAKQLRTPHLLECPPVSGLILAFSGRAAL